MATTMMSSATVVPSRAIPCAGSTRDEALSPTEAAARRPGESTNTSIAKLQEIRILHHRLMAIYVYAIATVSLKGPLPGTCEETSLSAQLADSPPLVTAQTQEIDGERKNAARSAGNKRRPVTKILVESHIKRKLGELKTAYTQIEQAVPD